MTSQQPFAIVVSAPSSPSPLPATCPDASSSSSSSSNPHHPDSTAKVRLPWIERKKQKHKQKHAQEALAVGQGMKAPTARPGGESSDDSDSSDSDDETYDQHKMQPKPQRDAPVETSEDGSLLPPMANPDLPRRLDRENSFMVLDLASLAAEAEGEEEGEEDEAGG